MAVEGKLIREVTVAVQAAAGQRCCQAQAQQQGHGPPPPAADQPTAPPAPLPRPPRTNQRCPRATSLRRAPTNGALSGGARPRPARGVGLAPVTGNRGLRFLFHAPPRSGHSKRKLHPFVGPASRPRQTHAPTAIAKLLLPDGPPGSRPRLLLPAHSKLPPQASPALFPGRPCPGAEVYPVRGGAVVCEITPGLAARPDWPAARELGPAANLTQLFRQQEAGGR